MTKTLEQTEQTIADHDGVDINEVREGVAMVSSITGATEEEIANSILQSELDKDDNDDEDAEESDDNEDGDNDDTTFDNGAA